MRRQSCAWVACLVMAAIGVTHSAHASGIPFLEMFDYTNGMLLDGVAGWEVIGGGSATALDGRAELQDARLRNTFLPSLSSPVVDIDFDTQPVLTTGGNFPPDSRCRFFVNPYGLVSALDGDSMTNLTHSPIVEGSSVTFRVHIDYALDLWSLSLNGSQIAADLHLSLLATNEFFAEWGVINTATSTSTMVDTVRIRRGSSPVLLPFWEAFDALGLGDLDGQRLWEATSAIVEGATSYQGGQACRLEGRSARLEHTFSNAQSQVWMDFYTRPDRGVAAQPSAGTTVAFYVNEAGHIVAYDGVTPRTLTETMVNSNAWVHITTFSDYGSQRWDLYLNGRLIAEGLGFFDVATSAFTAFGVYGTADHSPTYVDSIYIGEAPLPSRGSVLIIR